MQLGVGNGHFRGLRSGCTRCPSISRQHAGQLGISKAVFYFSNAFNSSHRRAILDVIATRAPYLSSYCYTAYAAPNSLKFGDFEISSEERIQQGDPLGPRLFYVCLQPILESIVAQLRIGHMDDLTFGRPALLVAQAVEDIQRLGEPLGLHLNPSKCEIIEGSSTADQNAFH